MAHGSEMYYYINDSFKSLHKTKDVIILGKIMELAEDSV